MSTQVLVTQFLPQDGADYHCTFTFDGWECGKLTTQGISLEDLNRFYELKAQYRTKHSNAPYVSASRALCETHINTLSDIMNQYKEGVK